MCGSPVESEGKKLYILIQVDHVPDYVVLYSKVFKNFITLKTEGMTIDAEEGKDYSLNTKLQHAKT